MRQAADSPPDVVEYALLTRAGGMTQLVFMGKNHVVKGDAVVVDLPADSGLVIRLLAPAPDPAPAATRKA